MFLEIGAKHNLHGIVSEDLFAEILCLFDLIWIVGCVLPCYFWVLLGSLVLITWVASELIVISWSLFRFQGGLRWRFFLNCFLCKWIWLLLFGFLLLLWLELLFKGRSSLLSWGCFFGWSCLFGFFHLDVSLRCRWSNLVTSLFQDWFNLLLQSRF